MSPDRSAIASSVATACTESAGTVQALAEEVGVSYAALCSWSRGRRRPPAHRLRKLADVLDDRAERLTLIARQLREQAGSAAPQVAGRSEDGMSRDSRGADGLTGPQHSHRPAMAAGQAQESGTDSGRGSAGDRGDDSRTWRASRPEVRRERAGSIPLPPPNSR